MSFYGICLAVTLLFSAILAGFVTESAAYTNQIGVAYYASSVAVSAQAYIGIETWQNQSPGYLNYSSGIGGILVEGTQSSYVVYTPAGDYLVAR